jgi:hypothetical protein
MPDQPPDTLADLLEARLAVATAERRLEQLRPTSLGRLTAEAALKRAQERYTRAAQAHEETLRRERDR